MLSRCWYSRTALAQKARAKNRNKMRRSFPIARIDGSDLKMHVTFFLLLEIAFTLTKRKRESPSLPLVFPHPQLSRTKSAWDKKFSIRAECF